jgi:lysophospholipase L1-like esterase
MSYILPTALQNQINSLVNNVADGYNGNYPDCKYLATNSVTSLDSVTIDTSPTLAAGDRALFPIAGTYCGIYVYSGTAWVVDPNFVIIQGGKVKVTNTSTGPVEYWQTAATGSGTAVFVRTNVTKGDLKLLFIGDSHTEGQLHGAVVSGTETIGAIAMNGPNDQQWLPTAKNAASIAPVFSARCAFYPPFNFAVNAGHIPSDGQLGSTSPNGSWVAWIPQMLRSAYSLVGKIRCANAGYGGSSSYTWSGNSRVGFFDCSGTTPADGDTATITVNGTLVATYTFRTTVSTAYDVLIGGSNTAAARNLEHAINADGTAGKYGAGTLISPYVFTTTIRSDQYVGVTSRLVGAGGGTFTIGGTGHIGLLQQITAGDNVSGLMDNVIGCLTAGPGFGTPDVICVLLGTNDAIRTGWGAIQYQTHMAAIISTLHTTYPTAKIILWYPPANAVTAVNTAITTYVNAATDALVAANPTFVTKIDAYNLPASSGNTAVLSADGTHLSVLGYQYVAQLVAKQIATVLGL